MISNEVDTSTTKLDADQIIIGADSPRSEQLNITHSTADMETESDLADQEIKIKPEQTDG